MLAKFKRKLSYDPRLPSSNLSQAKDALRKLCDWRKQHGNKVRKEQAALCISQSTYAAFLWKLKHPPEAVEPAEYAMEMALSLLGDLP